MPYKQFKSFELPNQLNSPILVNDMGTPRYWVYVWQILYAQNLAPSCKTKKLRYIETFYTYVNSVKDDNELDRLISNADIDQIYTYLEGYFVSISNSTLVSYSYQTQWTTVFSFIENILLGITQNTLDVKQFDQFRAKFFRLGNLYKQLKVQTPRRPDTLRSLPADVVAVLYEMLDPESKTQPFKRTRIIWTVYISFIVMLHQGLRRGELLLLSADCIKSSFDTKRNAHRYWINIQEKDNVIDPRFNKPSIKTNSSIRQLPVSEITANLIQTYIENYRGRPNHPFLLNSQWDTPVSHESITAYFRHISGSLPSSITKLLNDRIGKKTVQPHDLRHTEYLRKYFEWRI